MLLSLVITRTALTHHSGMKSGVTLCRKLSLNTSVGPVLFYVSPDPQIYVLTPVLWMKL